jgi:hypothetical protein
MRKTVLVMLLALAAVVSTAGLGRAGMGCVATDQAADVTEAVDDQVPSSPMRLAGGTFLPVQQDMKSKCLEQCADTRVRCEKKATAEDKPGTHKNWEASTRCQERYLHCLGTCE